MAAMDPSGDWFEKKAQNWFIDLKMVILIAIDKLPI